MKALRTVAIHRSIRTVYLFLTWKGCQQFTRALQRETKDIVSKFTFVLGTNCGTMLQVSESVQQKIEGLITIGLTDPMPMDFARHFEQLNPVKARQMYPYSWTRSFVESMELYYNVIYGCDNDQTCFNQPNKRFNKLATVRPVLDAVYAVAYSIRRSIANLCAKSNDSSCYTSISWTTQRNMRGALNRYMGTDHESGEEGPTFTKRNGDVVGNFNVYQYQKNRAGEYGFVKVGLWDYSKYRLGLNGLNMTPGFHVENSTCSVQCNADETTHYLDECKGICWKCIKCEWPKVILNFTQCTKCKQGEKPNAQRDSCIKLPVVSIHPTQLLSLVILTISGIFLCLTLVIFAVYIYNYEAPIIKATSRELSLFSMSGLALMLVLPVVIVQKPSFTSCCLQRVLYGLSLTCCYAPLMLKTNRIHRIFVQSQKFKLKKLNLVSLTSQFLLICGMIGVQLVIGVFWIMSGK